MPLIHSLEVIYASPYITPVILRETAMYHTVNELSRSALLQNCLSGLGAIKTKKEVEWVRQKLLAQTVVISKWIGEEARDPKKMHESLRGSGTLVRNGDTLGILTAGHVVRDLIHSNSEGGGVDMGLSQSLNPTKSGQQDGRLIRVPGWIERGGGVGIRKSHGDPLEKKLAEPDLAWIRIAEHDARKLGPEGLAGGVFHDWQKSERTRNRKMREQGREKYGLWICGWAHETGEKLLKIGRPGIWAAARQVFREGRVSVPEDGWDRFDYTLRPDGCPEEGYSDWGDADRSQEAKEILHADPSRWGGISGSGIWQIWREGGQEDMVVRCSLVGVVYAEHPPSEERSPVKQLRGHGIGSINRILEPSKRS